MDAHHPTEPTCTFSTIDAFHFNTFRQLGKGILSYNFVIEVLEKERIPRQKERTDVRKKAARLGPLPGWRKLDRQESKGLTMEDSSSRFLTPTEVSTNLPSWKKRRLGTLIIRNREANSLSLSTSTLPTVMRPANCSASWSMIGLSIRHGPHQLAQKSTTTTPDEII